MQPRVWYREGSKQRGSTGQLYMQQGRPIYIIAGRPDRDTEHTQQRIGLLRVEGWVVT